MTKKEEKIEWIIGKWGLSAAMGESALKSALNELYDFAVEKERNRILKEIEKIKP